MLRGVPSARFGPASIAPRYSIENGITNSDRFRLAFRVAGSSRTLDRPEPHLYSVSCPTGQHADRGLDVRQPA
jgi:hypothetical protein